jgi:hypothetical protein
MRRTQAQHGPSIADIAWLRQGKSLSTIKPWLTYCLRVICERPHRCGGDGREYSIIDGVDIVKFGPAKKIFPGEGTIVSPGTLCRRNVFETMRGFEDIRPRRGGDGSIS